MELNQFLARTKDGNEKDEKKNKSLPVSARVLKTPAFHIHCRSDKTCKNHGGIWTLPKMNDQAKNFFDTAISNPRLKIRADEICVLQLF